jgi:hypothetical protein
LVLTHWFCRIGSGENSVLPKTRFCRLGSAELVLPHWCCGIAGERPPQDRATQRFEFQDVKYSRVECGRTAFVVPSLS